MSHKLKITLMNTTAIINAHGYISVAWVEDCYMIIAEKFTIDDSSSGEVFVATQSIFADTVEFL